MGEQVFFTVEVYNGEMWTIPQTFTHVEDALTTYDYWHTLGYETRVVEEHTPGVCKVIKTSSRDWRVNPYPIH